MTPTPYNSRPANRFDLEGGDALHNDCGGAVARINYGSSWWGVMYGPWYCSKCSRRWNQRTVDNFTLEDLQDRFHVRVWAPDSTEVLVYVADPVTKRRYATCKPLGEAKGLKRVKL